MGSSDVKVNNIRVHESRKHEHAFHEHAVGISHWETRRLRYRSFIRAQHSIYHLQMHDYNRHVFSPPRESPVKSLTFDRYRGPVMRLLSIGRWAGPKMIGLPFSSVGQRIMLSAQGWFWTNACNDRKPPVKRNCMIAFCIDDRMGTLWNNGLKFFWRSLTMHSDVLWTRIYIYFAYRTKLDDLLVKMTNKWIRNALFFKYFARICSNKSVRKGNT